MGMVKYRHKVKKEKESRIIWNNNMYSRIGIRHRKTKR